MRHNKYKFNQWFSTAILSLLLCITLFPIIFIIYKAFTVSGENGSSFSLNELKNIILLSERYHTSFFNSILLAIIITLGQTGFGIIMAFIFSKFYFRGRDVLFYMCVLVMVLPSQTMLVQTYRTVENLSMLNKYAGVILPQIFLPVGILFLRQYFCRVSDSVIEASLIDGASTIKCLTKIIIPMSKNGIYLLVFLSFVDSYNTYEIPLIVLNNSDKWPLSLLFRTVIEKHPEAIFVPAVLYMIPAVLLFILIKDNIVNGIIYNE